ncbi:MAG: FtsQ-type POTRA domain-containing protein [Deltaproteobacteria bacterium]|nr:FtsQ-type POTRA domain-containing protein [Deltaproteobacteria bacterium]
MGEMVFRLLKRLFKVTALVLVVAVLAFIGRTVYGYMMDSPLLALREVVIEGCRKTSERDVLSLTQLDRRPNILNVKLGTLRSKVETHPWIEHAEIRRIFPDRISIRITERRPVAIILLDRLYYIDAHGVIFAGVPKDHHIGHPILTGLHRDDFRDHPDQSWVLVSKALRLIRVIKEARVLSQKDISEIHMDRTFGISIFTNDETIEIKLGLDHYRAKWKRLERVWRHLRQRSPRPAYIDCNYEKRVIVRMGDTTAFYAKKLTKNA